MIAIPPIADIPPVPQRGMDDEQFVQLADAFMNALPLFRGNLNDFALAFTAAFLDLSTVKFTSSSTTAVTVGAGAKAFTIGVGVAFSPGQVVMVASAADPTRYMQGAITSYDAQTGALVVAVTAIGAAGTRSDWKIGLVPAFDIEQRLATFKQASVDPLSAELGSLSPTARWAEASAAEARAGTASRLISAATFWALRAPVALVDAATIALDLSTGVNFTVTIGGNRTLGNPTNGRPGQEGSIFVTQDGTGGRVLGFGNAYVPDDLVIPPALNTGAGDVTELRFKVAANGKVRIYGGKPIGGGALQEQTISPSTDTSGNMRPSYFYASTAMTVMVTLINGEAVINKSTAASPRAFTAQNGGVALRPTGATTLAVTLEAGASIQIVWGTSVAGASDSWVNIRRTS